MLNNKFIGKFYKKIFESSYGIITGHNIVNNHVALVNCLLGYPLISLNSILQYILREKWTENEKVLSLVRQRFKRLK